MAYTEKVGKSYLRRLNKTCMPVIKFREISLSYPSYSSKNYKKIQDTMVKIDLTEHEGFPPHGILTSTFETVSQ